MKGATRPRRRSEEREPRGLQRGGDRREERSPASGYVAGRRINRNCAATASVRPAMKSPEPERVGSSAMLPLFSSHGAEGVKRPSLLFATAATYETSEAGQPLRERGQMGEGIRDTVLLPCCYLLMEFPDAPLDGMPFSSCAPPPGQRCASWVPCRGLVPVERTLRSNGSGSGLGAASDSRQRPGQVGKAARSDAPFPMSSSRSDQLRTTERCPTAGGSTSNPDRETGPRTEDLNTPPLRPALPSESNLKSASAAFPRGRPRGERINPQGKARATGTVPPRFLWRETSEKPDNAVIVSHTHASRIASVRVIARIVHSG